MDMHDLVLRPYDRGQMVGEKLGQLPAQPFHIHPAAAKQTLTVGVDGVAVQQMLQSQKLMLAHLHFLHRAADDSFQFLAQHNHTSSMEQRRGKDCFRAIWCTRCTLVSATSAV